VPPFLPSSHLLGAQPPQRRTLGKVSAHGSNLWQGALKQHESDKIALGKYLKELEEKVRCIFEGTTPQLGSLQRGE
jgi:hypothetical protein